jgi:hypothetical protein
MHATWRGSFSARDAATASLRHAGDLAQVERAGIPRSLVIACPDGCGEIITVNLDSRAGPAWRLRPPPVVSVYPSVWRDSGCRSHFIVSRGKIWWSLPEGLDAEELLQVEILSVLRKNNNHSVRESELVDTLTAEPWDIRAACRSLVRRRLISELVGNDGSILYRQSAQSGPS